MQRHDLEGDRRTGCLYLCFYPSKYFPGLPTIQSLCQKNVKEEEIDEVIPISLEEEIALAQERVPALPERETVPDSPVGEGGSTSVQKVF